MASACFRKGIVQPDQRFVRFSAKYAASRISNPNGAGGMGAGWPGHDGPDDIKYIHFIWYSPRLKMH
jgi:hypothetical protein